jgi:hypothetical protein
MLMLLLFHWTAKKTTSKFDWLGQIMWSIPFVNVLKLDDDDDDDSMKET